jgi:putative PIN family toxin of toxin-antitoxin system
MPKESIVVDVNLFLASLFFGSDIGDQILDSIKNKLFILLSCDEFVSEFERKTREFLKKRPLSEQNEIDFWLEFVQKLANYIKLKSEWRVCRDPKDDYLINLSLDGLAKYLITRDKDLLEIRRLDIQRIVISPEDFMSVLRKTQSSS